jgi:hypothetical protein
MHVRLLYQEQMFLPLVSSDFEVELLITTYGVILFAHRWRKPTQLINTLLCLSMTRLIRSDEFLTGLGVWFAHNP